MTTRQRILESNARVGRYRIVRELGRGGMGVVYLAHDDNLDRQVALKTTQVASIGASEQMRNQRRHRFIREVKALAQLSHENVVHVYDAGEADHPDLGWILYYTMQFVEGITLSELVIQRGATEPGAAAAICAQIASGLGAGHASGIIHRDVKPANVFLSVEGRALIGDFGIAKLADATQITRRDQMVGTPNYLAPEQILGEETTAATDVFALGALFYMVTMRRPLRTKVDAASLIQSARANAARGKMLSALTVPRGLRNVVARALEQDPRKRFSDGHAFAEALSEYASRIPVLHDETAAKQVDETAFRAQFRTVDTDTFSAPLQVVAAGADADFAPKVRPGDGDRISLIDPVDSARPADVSMTERGGPGAPGPKRARTESTALFNVRSLKLPEEMDFSGMDEELPNLVPGGAVVTKNLQSLPRGATEVDELYLLRSALAYLQGQLNEAPAIFEEDRLPLPSVHGVNASFLPKGAEPAVDDDVPALESVAMVELSVPEFALKSEPVSESESALKSVPAASLGNGSVTGTRPDVARETPAAPSESADDLVDDAVFDGDNGNVRESWVSRLAARWRSPKN